MEKSGNIICVNYALECSPIRRVSYRIFFVGGGTFVCGKVDQPPTGGVWGHAPPEKF